MPDTGTAAPATDTATDTTTQETHAVVPPVPQKYKLGEDEYDETTLKKMVADAKKADEAFRRAKEIERGGRAKLEEASSLRKQFTAIKDIVHENPEGGLLEMAKLFGLPDETLDKMFQHRVVLQKQWETMSDDQKARYMAEQRLQTLEAEKKERETAEAEAKSSQELKARQDTFEKKLATNTLPVMQQAGLHPTPLKLKLVAATLGAIADRDGPETEPDLEEAVAYVAEAYNKDLDDSVGALDPEAFVKRYPELAEKLRKYEVARATGRSPAGNAGRPPAPRAEPPDNGKNESWSDFSKRMRALQMGKRA